MSKTRPIDLAAIAATKAQRDGVDLDEAAWRLLSKQIEAGLSGDLSSAKLALERLCGAREEPQKAGKIDWHKIHREVTEQLREAGEAWKASGHENRQAWEDGYRFGCQQTKRGEA